MVGRIDHFRFVGIGLKNGPGKARIALWRRGRVRRLIWMFAVLVAIIAGGNAAAQSLSTLTGQTTTDDQSTVTLPDPLTPEAIDSLVSQMSDVQVRQLLLEHLKSGAQQDVAAGEAAGQSTTAFVATWVAAVRDSFGDSIERLPLLTKGTADTVKNFIDDRGGPTGALMFVLGLLAGIAAGLLAYWLVLQSPIRRFVRRPEPDATFSRTARLLAIRLAVDVLAIAVFVAVSIAVHSVLLGPQNGPTTQLFMGSVVMAPLFVAAVSRFLLSPNWPDARLVHTDDWTARYLHRHEIAIASLIGLFVFFMNFAEMNGVDMIEASLGFWLNLVVFIWLGIVTYRIRDGLAQMLIGKAGDATPLEMRVARAFPWIFIAALVGIWILVPIVSVSGGNELLYSGSHIATLVLIALTPAADTMIRGLVRHLVPPMQGEGPVAERAYQSTKRSYIRIGRVIVFAWIIRMIAGQWQIDFSDIASANLGEQLAARAFEVVFILAVGYLLWELATLWFNRKLAAEQTAGGFDLTADEPGGGEGGGQGGSRLSTVLPIIRLAVQLTIMVLTFLVALRHLGIDITPLLAGAGIVGIAIGFGAQTLVRDVVSGLFFLIDDAFRVGEYLVIDDTVGTVEKLNVRSLQLRHHTGPVHTIPYGEIPKVTNNSRDWVIMKMKFTFPFETDPNRIKKIFKKIGQDMLETEYADDLLQTFKSQGVYDVDDVGMVIRGKFMARPGTQWIIRKDIYNRVAKALDEAGIQFARKEVRVQIPGLEEAQQLTAPQTEAIAAAASEAAETFEPAPPAKR